MEVFRTYPFPALAWNDKGPDSYKAWMFSWPVYVTPRRVFDFFILTKFVSFGTRFRINVQLFYICNAPAVLT